MARRGRREGGTGEEPSELRNPEWPLMILLCSKARTAKVFDSGSRCRGSQEWHQRFGSAPLAWGTRPVP